MRHKNGNALVATEEEKDDNSKYFMYVYKLKHSYVICMIFNQYYMENAWN